MFLLGVWILSVWVRYQYKFMSTAQQMEGKRFYTMQNNIAWFCFFLLQVRSEIITTYALCGFANFSSLGIVIGGLCECWIIPSSCFCPAPGYSLSNDFWHRVLSFLKASICPSRKRDVSSLVLRAMITGTCVSLVNASIAGKSVWILLAEQFSLFPVVL